MKCLAREEAGKLIEQEMKRRKVLRLEQAREQATAWMEANKTKYETEKEKQYQILTEKVLEEARAEALTNIDRLVLMHDLTLAEIGAAHRAATAVVDHERIRTIKMKQNIDKARDRGKEALRIELTHMLELKERATMRDKHRRKVRLEEDKKSKVLVELQPYNQPSPGIIEIENKFKPPEFQQRLSQKLFIPMEARDENGKSLKKSVRFKKQRAKKFESSNSGIKKSSRRSQSPGGLFGSVAEERLTTGRSPKLTKRPVTFDQENKPGRIVSYYDKTQPGSKVKYVAPKGLTKSHLREVQPNAWDLANQINNDQTQLETRGRLRQHEMEERARERGLKALRIARLEKKYKALENQLISEDHKGKFGVVAGISHDSLLGLEDAEDEEVPTGISGEDHLKWIDNELEKLNKRSSAQFDTSHISDSTLHAQSDDENVDEYFGDLGDSAMKSLGVKKSTPSSKSKDQRTKQKTKNEKRGKDVLDDQRAEVSGLEKSFGKRDFSQIDDSIGKTTSRKHPGPATGQLEGESGEKPSRNHLTREKVGNQKRKGAKPFKGNKKSQGGHDGTNQSTRANNGEGFHEGFDGENVDEDEPSELDESGLDEFGRSLLEVLNDEDFDSKERANQEGERTSGKVGRGQQSKGQGRDGKQQNQNDISKGGQGQIHGTLGTSVNISKDLGRVGKTGRTTPLSREKTNNPQMSRDLRDQRNKPGQDGFGVPSGTMQEKKSKRGQSGSGQSGRKGHESGLSRNGDGQKGQRQGGKGKVSQWGQSGSGQRARSNKNEYLDSKVPSYRGAYSAQKSPNGNKIQRSSTAPANYRRANEGRSQSQSRGRGQGQSNEVRPPWTPGRVFKQGPSNWTSIRKDGPKRGNSMTQSRGRGSSKGRRSGSSDSSFNRRGSRGKRREFKSPLTFHQRSHLNISGMREGEGKRNTPRKLKDKSHSLPQGKKDGKMWLSEISPKDRQESHPNLIITDDESDHEKIENIREIEPMMKIPFTSTPGDENKKSSMSKEMRKEPNVQSLDKTDDKDNSRAQTPSTKKDEEKLDRSGEKTKRDKPKGEKKMKKKQSKIMKAEKDFTSSFSFSDSDRTRTTTDYMSPPHGPYPMSSTPGSTTTSGSTTLQEEERRHDMDAQKQRVLGRLIKKLLTMRHESVEKLPVSASSSDHSSVVAGSSAGSSLDSIHLIPLSGQIDFDTSSTRYSFSTSSSSRSNDSGRMKKSFLTSVTEETDDWQGVGTSGTNTSGSTQAEIDIRITPMTKKNTSSSSKESGENAGKNGDVTGTDNSHHSFTSETHMDTETAESSISLSDLSPILARLRSGVIEDPEETTNTNTTKSSKSKSSAKSKEFERNIEDVIQALDKSFLNQLEMTERETFPFDSPFKKIVQGWPEISIAKPAW